MAKIYLVQAYTGAYEEYQEVSLFACVKENEADSWVKKFNEWALLNDVSTLSNDSYRTAYKAERDFNELYGYDIWISPYTGITFGVESVEVKGHE